MLVLTREVNESIKIGDDIEVTVVEVQGKKERLGVAAPRTVAVDWAEVAVSKAANSTPPPKS